MKDIGGGLGQAGTNASRNISRNMGKINHGIQGSRAYNATFKASKSIYAREMLDAKIGRQAFSKMHKAINHIKHYNIRHIEKIQKRFEHNPRSLDKHITALANHFADDIRLFASSMKQYLDSIYDGLVLANKEFAIDEELILSLIVGFKEAMKHDKVVVPDVIIDKIEHGIHKLKIESKRIANNEAKADKRFMKRERKNHVGHVARSSWHKVRKVLTKTEQKHVQELRENMRKMEDEIENKQAKLSFLAYYEDYLSNKHVLNKAHKEICMDFLLMIEKTEQYYEKMIEGIKQFEAMFRSYESVKEIQKQILVLQEDHKTLEADLQADIEMQHKQYSVTVSVAQKTITVLEQIRALSKENLKIDMDKIRHLKPKK